MFKWHSLFNRKLQTVLETQKLCGPEWAYCVPGSSDSECLFVPRNICWFPNRESSHCIVSVMNFSDSKRITRGTKRPRASTTSSGGRDGWNITGKLSSPITLSRLSANSITSRSAEFFVSQIWICRGLCSSLDPLGLFVSQVLNDIH